MKVNRKYKKNYWADFLMIIIILLLFILTPLGYRTPLQNALFIIAFGILLIYLKTKFLLDCVLEQNQFKITYHNNMGIERSTFFSRDDKFVVIKRNSIFGKKTLVRVFQNNQVHTFVVLDEEILSKLPESNLQKENFHL